MTEARDYIPGLANVPAAESSVCYLDGNIGKLQYRGYPIEQLSEHSTYEEVAYLLVYGELPTQAQLSRFDADLKKSRKVKFRIIDLLKTLPDNGHPMDALGAAVAATSMFYPGDHVNDAEFRNDCVIRLIAKLPTIVAAWQRVRNGDDPIKSHPDLGHAANFLYILTGDEPEPLIAHTMDVALILHAEHQMNASTFAARVTGSALADPLRGRVGCDRNAVWAAARRRERRSASHAQDDSGWAAGDGARVGRGPACAQTQDLGFRSSRIQSEGPARDDFAEARRARVREARQHAAL